MRTNATDRGLRKCGSPQLYGGTERVVSHLTEELVRQGHKVTLFASGDSQTDAILRAPCDRALRLSSECKDPLVYHYISLNRVARSADAFDIIHFHTDYLHFPLFAQRWRKVEQKEDQVFRVARVRR